MFAIGIKRSTMLGSVAFVGSAVLPLWFAPAMAQDNSTLETVTVTGYRASLERAMDIKRSSAAVVDSITAEDLGKFPDSNVAEALQRMPGVTISRDGTGQGSQITVRGFGPQFNSVFVNDRPIGNLNGGRDFSFELLPAELISGADVYKSSTASQQSGGIGALVNLRTPHPLEIGKQQIVVTAKENYEDLAAKTSPSVFGLYSDVFMGGKLGVMVSASYQSRDTRQNSAGVESYLPNQTVGYTDANNVQHDLAKGVFSPRDMTYEVHTDKVERKTVNGVIQYQPIDDLVLTVDAIWNRYNDKNMFRQLSHWFTQSNVTALTLGANKTVTGMTTDNSESTDYVVNFGGSPTVTQQTGFNAKWKNVGGLPIDLRLDASNSAAYRTDGPGGFLVIGHHSIAQYVNTGSGIPNVTVQGADGTFGQNDFSNTDINKAHSTWYGNGGGQSRDVTSQVKFDGVWNAGLGVLTDVKFGAIYWRENKQSHGMDTLEQNLFGGYTADIPSSLMHVFNAGDNFVGKGNYPTQWLTYDPNEYLNYLRGVASKAVAGAADINNPKTYDPAYVKANAAWLSDYMNWNNPASPNYNPANAKSFLNRASNYLVSRPSSGGESMVREEVYGGYISATLDGTFRGLPYNIDAGVRWEHTHDMIVGKQKTLLDLLPSGNDITIFTPVYVDPAAPGGTSDTGAAIRVVAHHDYDNLLPSMNVRLNLTDELVARGAVSQSLTRPYLWDMQPSLNYGTLRHGTLTASDGNPNLKPYRSTNFDLGLEWYYQKNGYLSLSVYQKEIDDFIVGSNENEVFPIKNAGNIPEFAGGKATFSVYRPHNTGSATVRGLELAYQHNFVWLPEPFDGLGLTANITLVASPATLAQNNADVTKSFALEGVGNSQNLTLFYEKGPLGIRAAYTHRNKYLSKAHAGYGNEPLFIKSTGYLDGQISYDITENFSLMLDGNNLLNAKTQSVGRYSNQWVSYLATGRRYMVGLRANF
ncbi:TonB-dependent receptor [Rhizomicrobium palustre]|uniref:TonB-dependent receptor n=1 Tax=Rhizomicrobium palustre TaxID=189966 RepID=A0A846N3E8_9PROT|nr:TonB-dependent receptor [Rhizomicrobium palustre]NIK90508.1 TonB-dependent receptor [Rhizomicrobium palustre]